MLILIIYFIINIHKFKYKLVIKYKKKYFLSKILVLLIHLNSIEFVELTLNYYYYY